MYVKDIVTKLHQIGAIKVGTFILKSGYQSPIYIDLRAIISFPSLLANVSDCIWDKIAASQANYICGVPYTALPIATCISVKHDMPMVIRRKERKTYGTKRQIEGIYDVGESCVIVEDVVTTGSSVLETIGDLEEEGLNVKQVVCFLDREQGGREQLLQRGYQFASVLSLTTLITQLERYTDFNINERD